MRSFAAPVDVRVTVPELPADTGPFTVIMPVEATTEILPRALVVILAMLTLPVDAVNVKPAATSSISVRSVVRGPEVIE